MTDFDSQLSKLLDQFDDKHRATDEETQNRLRTIDQFICDFEKRRLAVLAPVLQELGKALKSRGHDFFIKESYYQRGSEGPPSPASISLEIFLKGQEYGRYGNPHLEYITQDSSRTVVVHTSTMGSHGGLAEADPRPLQLQEITPDAIRRRFLLFFEALTNK